LGVGRVNVDGVAFWSAVAVEEEEEEEEEEEKKKKTKKKNGMSYEICWHVYYIYSYLFTAMTRKF
jgi:hypothetical protein